MSQSSLQIDNITKKDKILVVDDDKLIRDNMKRMLGYIAGKLNLDYEIIEGSDGVDLVNMVLDDTKNLIKFIFTDENMTELDGSEAISRVKDIKITNCIKVISITSLDDVYSVQRILDCGADRVLQKPARRTIVEEILKSYLLI
jgi:CheY-like chemotaxis protein